MSTCPHPEKIRHHSKKAALKARDSLEAGHGLDLALRPYRCGDHWHLGHKGTTPRAQLAKALAAGRKNARQARRRRTR